MKTAKGWRQLSKEIPKPNITKEELYEYLETIFFNRTYPENVTVTPTYWATEEGVEMVTIVSPTGVMMTRAKNWSKALEDVARPFTTENFKYIMGHDPYTDETPITSTKLTLDHGIEVIITYDEKES